MDIILNSPKASNSGTNAAVDFSLVIVTSLGASFYHPSGGMAVKIIGKAQKLVDEPAKSIE
jgi:hypothetical protein